MDDYRDQIWRDGSTGSLGNCRIGSGIAASRFVSSDGKEVEELFCQVASSAIHGRRFTNAEGWKASEQYNVDWTLSNVTTTSSIASTTVKHGNDSFLLLAYVSTNESLMVQTRASNVSSGEYNAFSLPVALSGGDRRPDGGLAAFGVSDQAGIIYVNGKKHGNCRALM